MAKMALNKYFLFGLSVSVGACGGGNTESEPDPTIPNYETLISTSNNTSKFAATAILSDPEGKLTLERSSGSVQHPSGAIWTGHEGVLEQEEMASKFQYALIYNQSFSEEGRAFDAFGVGGIVTSAIDMPARTRETVTYNGQSLAQLITADTGYDLVGQSTVTVNFDAGTVDTRMDRFVATELADGETVDSPISVISVDGSNISENSFSGGKFTIEQNGSVVDVAGANSSSDMFGNFFGYDAANATPDEVGGVFLQQGSDGILAGGFVAD